LEVFVIQLKKLGVKIMTLSVLLTSFVFSDKIKIGIIPLTDCASVVMAGELGLFKKYGVDVEVSKEASWANVRDKLISGDLQAAHCLFGMPFSVYNGIGGKPGTELKIAMILNINGQAITLNKDFIDKTKFKSFDHLKDFVYEKIKNEKECTFAMTFPGGTHDIWLRNWLALAGIDQTKVKIITIPPPQMVANMKVGNMDGFCVGEPWGGVAAKNGIGFTHIATQDIWQDHPEKALVVNPAFAEKNKDDLKKMMKAILEASAYLDKLENRKKAAEIIGGQSYVNAPADVIDARLMGQYQLGGKEGTFDYKGAQMMFHKGGAVNYPKKSYGIWFMAQYVRFGLMKTVPDYKAVADKLIMTDLYKEVAKEMKLPLEEDMKPFALSIDKTPFDPAHPEQYLKVVKN
jgi:nitrate/nitrite transport system substrate-binding protein